MNISVVGWYGKHNVGDDAFEGFFRSLCKGHTVEFVTPPRKCDNPDLVILGGGAVASPFYLNNLPDCPRYALGIDLAYESEANLLKQAGFREIVVRHAADVALLQDVGCPVSAAPDLAFHLSTNWEHRVQQYKQETWLPTLGVFITDYVNPALDRPLERFETRARQFQQGLAAQLDVLAQDYEIMLVPCSTGGYGDDRRVNLDVAAFMKSRPTVLMQRFTPAEMVELCQGMEVTLCMRFHSHIFSMIAGVPFVSIEFTRKVASLLKEYSLEHLTAVRQQNNQFFFEELVEKVQKAAWDAGAMKAQVARNFTTLEQLKKRVRQDWFGDLA